MADFWGKEVKSSGAVTFFSSPLRCVNEHPPPTLHRNSNLMLDSWMQTLHLNFAAPDKPPDGYLKLSCSVFSDAASVGLSLWGMCDTCRDELRYDGRELRDPSCVVLPQVSSIWIFFIFYFFYLREVFLCSNRGSVDRR